ncbi:hypothetical protein [Saccharothrix sp. HUAS TT1]|uniref:hypothetical protein n=1 Tax=unclassified Saccharothrix TaxID=2593673 RepID=UPI00345C60E5
MRASTLTARLALTAGRAPIALTTGRKVCLLCGSRLRSMASIRAGYSRRCLARVRAARQAELLAHFTEAQIEAARELIADGGIVQSHKNVWTVVSSKGDRRYLTAPNACNCPAGLHSRPCYHRAAVALLADVSPAAA